MRARNPAPLGSTFDPTAHPTSPLEPMLIAIGSTSNGKTDITLDHAEGGLSIRNLRATKSL